MAGRNRRIDTEALIALFAQMEQVIAQQEVVPPATRCYNPPANYYEHRSPNISPPLERCDYQIQSSVINPVNQHQLYGLPDEHTIDHDERDVGYFNSQRFEQRQRYQPGSLGFQQNFNQVIQDQSQTTNAFQQQRYLPGSLGFHKNFTQGFKDQSQTTNALQQEQQPFAHHSAPPQPTAFEESHDELKLILQQLIIEQQRSNKKLDSMYATLSGKFESLSSHVKRLDLQVAQDAERLTQRQEVPLSQAETNPEADHEPRIEQEEETTSAEKLGQQQARTQSDPTVKCRTAQVPKEAVDEIERMMQESDERWSKHLTDKPTDSPPPAIEETPKQHDTIQVATGSEPAAEGVEPPVHICNPPSGTPFLNALQKKSGSGQVVPCSFISYPPSPPRRSLPKRIPRSPKVHPPDTGVRLLLVARIHHQQLLYAKYSGIEGEDPFGRTSQAN